MKLTERTIANLTYSKQGKTADYRWDDNLKGFCVRVYKSGRKVYLVIYRNQNNTKRFYKLGTYPELKVAQARERAIKILADVRSGKDPQTTRQENRLEPDFETFCNIYIEHFKDHKKSIHKDRQRLRDHILPTLGKRKLSEISSPLLIQTQKKWRDKKLSNATCNRCLSLLSHILNMAVKWGYLDKSQTHALQRFREPPARDIVLTPEQARALYEACEQDSNLFAGALFRAALLTGRRIGELRSLKWTDYDPRAKRAALVDTKANEKQYIYMSEAAAELFDSIPKTVGNPYIFSGTSFGRPINGYARPWKRIIEKAEIPYFPPHGLRHNYASMLIASGEPLEVVGHLLGHKTVTTTRKYAHHRPEGLQKTANQLTRVIDLHGKKNRE